MDHKQRMAHIREAKRLARATEDQKQEARIDECLRRWKQRTIWLGLALAASVGLVVPFLAGHSLHRYSPTVGRILVYLSMCLLVVFMYAVGTTYNFGWYLRAVKRIHGKREG